MHAIEARSTRLGFGVVGGCLFLARHFLPVLVGVTSFMLAALRVLHVDTSGAPA